MDPLLTMLGRLLEMQTATPTIEVGMTAVTLLRFRTSGQDLQMRMHFAAHGYPSVVPSLGEVNQWRHRADSLTRALGVLDPGWYASFWKTYYRSAPNLPRDARRMARESELAPAGPEPSPGDAVEYDLHNWSPKDIAHALAQVKGWGIPYVWNEPTQVLAVPAKYEEVANKLILGED